MRELLINIQTGKEDLDIALVTEIMVSLGKTREEKLVLERMKNNSTFVEQIKREYYMHTPPEVKNTSDFISWVNNWEERRGNL